MSIAEMIRSADKFKSELRAAKEFDFVEHPSGLPPDLIDACVAVVMAERRAGLEWPLDAPQPADPVPGRLQSVYAAQMAKPRKIYLSGPMKGYPESNYPLFRRIAAELREMGHEVYNPAEFGHDGPHETFPLRKAFAAYSAYICTEADTIVLLAGWEKSLGVSAELALAKNCKLEIIEHHELFACVKS